MYATTGIDFSMSMDLEIRQQRSCVHFKLRTKMIQDVNSAFSPDQTVLSF